MIGALTGSTHWQCGVGARRGIVPAHRARLSPSPVTGVLRAEATAGRDYWRAHPPRMAGAASLCQIMRCVSAREQQNCCGPRRLRECARAVLTT